MKKAVMILIASTLVLASCGTVRESRFNPFIWFGKSRSQPVAEGVEVNPLIPRRNAFAAARRVEAGVLIDQVAELVVERRPGGAVIRARGVSATVGISKARLSLVEEESTDMDRIYELLYIPFPARIAGGSEAARSVMVAKALTDRELQQLRTITVRAARNERVTRR
jgi:hypothetical protein